MSQVYSISLKFEFLSIECAKDALQRRIAKGREERVNYSLDHYKGDVGLDLDNVHDLVRLFFGGWDANLREGLEPGWLHAGFNASYGWEDVMMTAFEDIAPFLDDGSEIVIDVDEGVDHGVVKDGSAVWLQ